VVQIGIETVHGKTAHFGQVLWLSIKRFFPVLGMVTLIAIVTLGLFSLSQINVFVLLAVLLPIIFMATILQMYPVIYSIVGKSTGAAMLVLGTFIRERFQLFVQLLLFIVLLTMILMLFSKLLLEPSDLPLAVKSIVLPVIEGCYLVAVNYAIIIVWLVQSKVRSVA